MITVLAGGIGAAKFLQGLAAVINPEEITVIVNTGDDALFHGLHVSPDLDTVMYTLAGVVDPERGWGLRDETFRCLGALKALGEESWFQLGDQDLATHLFRTRRLREGHSLTSVTAQLCAALGVRARLLPMTDEPAPTILRTSAGVLPFQEYFVKLRQEPEVLGVDLSAAQGSEPAPGVVEAIESAAAVIIAPSNPVISIGPVVSIRKIQRAISACFAPVLAISPIVGGKALKGPADRMLASLGYGSSAVSVARLYRALADIFVLDQQDAELRPEIEALGMKVEVTDTVMRSPETKARLAQAVLEALSVHGRK